MQISKKNYLFYFISLIVCFLLFRQSDITHTNASSFAYLHGHIANFYDYNKPLVGGNDYLPLVYLIFALWNLPLKLLELIPEVTSSTWMTSSTIIIIWSKLLLVIFFFASIGLLGKISNQIGSFIGQNSNQKMTLTPSLLFLTSPFAIFSVFIFSGYDIFGAFFTLLGLYCYFQKKFFHFACWFSIAISLKFFAALIYLPLVLIIEKRILWLLAYGLMGLLASAIQYGLYWHSEIFRSEIFNLLMRKTDGETTHLKLILGSIAYCAVALRLYFLKIDISKNPIDWSRAAIFACIFSYALLFSLVHWHPQWIVIILPFTYLGYHFVVHQRILSWLEMIGYIGFICWCVNGWVQNVDITMAYGGVFGGSLPATQHFGADILSKKWMGFSRTVFYIFLYSPLVIYSFEYLTKVVSHTGLYSSLGQVYPANSSAPVYDVRTLLFGRFFVASYFFIALTVICLAWN